MDPLSEIVTVMEKEHVGVNFTFAGNLAARKVVVTKAEHKMQFIHRSVSSGHSRCAPHRARESLCMLWVGIIYVCYLSPLLEKNMMICP